MEGGMSYADVEQAVPVSTNVVSDPPMLLHLALARRQDPGARRPPPTDARHVQNRAALLRADLPVRRIARRGIG